MDKWVYYVKDVKPIVLFFTVILLVDCLDFYVVPHDLVKKM